MFEKYPDQASERRQYLLAGIIFGVVAMLFFLGGAEWLTVAILLPSVFFIPVALFCSHAGFERAKRIASFFVGFS